MTKHKKLPAEKANGKPIAEPKLATDNKPIGKTSPYAKFVAANLLATSPHRFIEDAESKNRLAQDSVELYAGLKPRNAQEAMISLLALSVANASLDCLTQASMLDMGQFTLRDLNLRHGMKGATIAAELLKALNDLRSEKHEKVTVGNVNVEAGGQAIVGNVESLGPGKGRQEN
jgi:hypothetical protein